MYLPDKISIDRGLRILDDTVFNMQGCWHVVHMLDESTFATNEHTRPAHNKVYRTSVALRQGDDTKEIVTKKRRKIEYWDCHTRGIVRIRETSTAKLEVMQRRRSSYNYLYRRERIKCLRVSCFEPLAKRDRSFVTQARKWFGTMETLKGQANRVRRIPAS